MFYTADCVVETSTSTGTGDFVLAGALTGYHSFSDWFSVGDSFYYLIEGIDGRGARTGEWETGYGTYSAANTLTRTAVDDSSVNFGDTINFSAGTKRVSVVLSRACIGFTGTLAKKSADQTGADYTTETAIAWDSETYDLSGAHSTVTNNSRITPGVMFARCKLKAQVSLANVTVNKMVTLGIKMNGSYSYPGVSKSVVQANTTTPFIQVHTPLIDLTTPVSDYFEAFLQVETDTSVDIVAAQSWFYVERVI